MTVRNVDHGQARRGQDSAPAGPSPTPEPSSRGAVGLGLGIEVVLPATEASPEAPVVRDELDTTPRHEAASVSQPAREVPSDAFARLPRSTELPPRPLSDKPLSLGREVDLPVDAKLALLGLEQAAPAAEGFVAVRTGLMLLASDGQRWPSPEAKEAGEAVATQIYRGNRQAAVSELATFVKKSEYAQHKAQGEITALVQAALREAYLLGSEALRDQAARVKQMNESKKKLRQLIEEARTTEVRWREARRAQGGDEGWVSPEPLVARTVDEDTGEVMDEPWTAAQEAEAAQARTVTTGGGVYTSYQALYGKSQLSGSEKRFIKECLEKKGRAASSLWLDDRTDDFITDNLDRVAAIVQKMNARELKKYFGRILKILSGGNTDEAAIIRLYKTLTPMQATWLVSGGFRPETLAASIWDTLRAAGGSATIAYATPAIAIAVPVAVGFAVGEWGLSKEDRRQIDRALQNSVATLAEELKTSVGERCSAKEAVALLVQIKLAHEPPQHSTPTGGKAPAVRELRTVEELGAYVERLEETLNSVGDDAQLANLDLQNELQRQQHLLQMISNISKMLHDTAMAAVRKLGT